ncbi:MAG: Phytanoyl-CoA dioxygenase [Gammaproteobacteria bacterium]|nr:Phytanoyl-CoA dioxygenase [Gammaproteobacteria bacterium]
MLTLWRMNLDANTVAEFHEHGFTTLAQISTPAELALLRTVFERLFTQGAGRKEGAQYDILGHDSDLTEQALPTIINPANYAAELRRLKCAKMRLQSPGNRWGRLPPAHSNM